MDPTAIDDLGNQPHVREVSTMVATEGRLSDDKLLEISKCAAAFVKPRPQWTPRTLALPWGDTNETYVYEFLRGNHKAIPADSLQKLARIANEWAETEHKKEQRQSPRGFVHTRVVKRLLKGIQFAVETGDIVVAHGPAGCGKSATLEHAMQVFLTAVYVYITPDCSKKGGFLRALYRAIWGHAAPSRVTFDDILVRLRGSGRPLFIDNADGLTPDVFPTIMALHDVAEIPIIIVGTHKILERLTADADCLRGQMSSRIGMRIELLSEQTAPRHSGGRGEWVGADEIRGIFETAKIKLHPSAVARLKAVANNEIGKLRRCERLMRYALVLADARSGAVQITDELLARAAAIVDGATETPVRPERERVLAEAS